MSKIISCGILIFHDDKLLLCHPTNFAWNAWNIPKGKLEEGESFKECALRETFEETNIPLWNVELKELGLFDYTPKKDLYLFSTKIENVPVDIKCTTYVVDKNGNNLFLEHDEFHFVEVCQLYKWTSKNMFNTLHNAIITLNNISKEKHYEKVSFM